MILHTIPETITEGVTILLVEYRKDGNEKGENKNYTRGKGAISSRHPLYPHRQQYSTGYEAVDSGNDVKFEI